MRAGRQRGNEQAICGWGQQNEQSKVAKIYTPSPHRRTSLLPQLALPSLRPPPIAHKQPHPHPHRQSNRVLPSKRLKTESFDEGHNCPGPISETPSPIRLFPSLPVLSSAEHINVSSTEPAFRQQTVLDLFSKRFKKYREMEEGFNFKLLQNRPDKLPERKSQGAGTDNPEAVFRQRESKPMLKLSTIQIDSSELKRSVVRSKPAQKRGSPKQVEKIEKIEKLAPSRSKFLSKVGVHGQGQGELPISILKKTNSKVLPPLVYEGEFSDQTIFPHNSPSHASLSLSAVPSPPSQRVRVVVRRGEGAIW